MAAHDDQVRAARPDIKFRDGRGIADPGHHRWLRLKLLSGKPATM
jgi:hypothetical protein